MTLILVEVDTSEPKPEMTFTKPVVRVGREAGECDVVFDGTRFPMVSRRHAEFRAVGDGWEIADLNSSYGVYVNGQRVATRQPVGVGNKIQFGTDGPAVVVIWLEAAKELAPPEVQRPDPRPDPKPSSAPAPAVPKAAPPAVPAIAPEARASDAAESWEMGPVPPVKPVEAPVQRAPAVPAPPPAPAPVITAKLEFADDPARPHVALKAQTVWLGRDPGCDVVIDGNAGMVSRRHAQIRNEGGGFVVEDNNSFNGTLVNDHRIFDATPLRDGDRIQLGVGGPVLRFSSSAAAERKGAGAQSIPAAPPSVARGKGDSLVPGQGTMVFDRERAAELLPKEAAAQPQLLMSVPFGDRPQLTIGRNENNDIRLDGLQISNRHARLTRTSSGIVVEDVKSTNGVYVNGGRVSKHQIGPHDSVQIGAFLITVDAADVVNVYDTRSRTRIDVVNVSRVIKGHTLLDSISLSIQPNEFVGLLGPSGAGKSMLMEAMNGNSPADSGSVLVNSLALYKHHDSLKQSIGYVPQDDIIHRELTVYRSLYYVAKMRLSRDVSSAEIKQIVEEVMDVTGLSERRDVRVKDLSGGQRKRVSIAVELITKPSVIFLDEPTSGLDPGAEERIMKLFRHIAEAGRTVVMTTHAMENIRLFDKIAVLMAGKLVFYGKPDEALAYLKASSFKELYAKLEEPIGVREQGEASRRQATERAAENWKTKFRSTPQYREYIEKPLSERGSMPEAGRQKKRRLGIIGAVRQWMILSQRYFEVLLRDKVTLFILLAQAPIIALMTFIVTGADQPRDFVFFVLAIVAVWFGTSVSAREIVRERPVYKRERKVNLGLLPYLASKLFIIGIIVTVQCLLLFVPLKILDAVGLMSMPGELAGIPQLWAVLLTAAVGIASGLFVSALVRTSEMATGLVPLILIPQMLFSGLAGVPEGVSRPVSLTMPAAWSFDTIKRFSTLDTLEPEGANSKGKTRGLGLYKYIEAENEKTIAKAKKDLEDFKRGNENRFQDEAPVDTTDLSNVAIRRVPDDLSGYVTFLHPWMNEVLNQLVLMVMFGLLVFATLVVLRLRDN